MEAGVATLAETKPRLPDFSKWGAVTRERMGGLRRAATRTTSVSWRLIPHVTQFDRADITDLEEQRKTLGHDLEQEGIKLTVTAIIVKAVVPALRKFPRFHASVDEENEEIVYKHYMHIGVAVDTERGLVVPVIRDADRKPLRQVAVELAELAEKARSRKLTPDEMTGAGFSVSNLGGLGTTYFTPLVTWPQVAVLGVGRAEIQPVFRQGDFVARRILPLAISYDHRLIDGADAARFLRWIAESLERPLRLLLEG
jgi:pyruvate dehydrogenase E2 component (dihydrolipoamide acetyltransferase)